VNAYCAAVNHQVPNRVPINLDRLEVSGIAVIALDKAKRQPGIATPIQVADVRFLIGRVEERAIVI
jgi:hypothetical protein